MKQKFLFTAILASALIVASCAKKSANLAEAPANSNSNTPVAEQTQVPTFTDANLALAEGNRLLDENRTEAAIDVLKQAVTLDPDLAEGHFKLGIAYSLLEMQQKQSGIPGDEPASNSKDGKLPKTNSEKSFERAVEAYLKWIAAHPKDDVAQFNLGRTYAKLGQDDDAEEAFQKAVDLKEDDSEYQTELGAILIKLAKYREAIDPLKEAVNLDGENVRAQDLLEDAEAGRQRLDYVSNKKDANQSTGKKNSGSNANMSSNSNWAGPSNSTTPSKPPSNAKPPEKDKKPNPTPAKPN